MFTFRPSRIWSMVSFFSCIAVISCATYQGVAEFGTYRNAFEASHATGNSILDILATKERRIFLSANPPSNTVYDPNFASYYTDVADPPGTASFRNALNSVKAYNDVLYGLASGEAAKSLSTRLLTLRTSITSAVTEVHETLDARGAKRVELTATLTRLNSRLSAADELIAFALKYRSREDFRQFVVEYTPVVEELLLSLRDGTTIIFPALTRDATASFDGVDEKKIATYRQLLSDWVLGLETTIFALKRVSRSVGSKASFSESIYAFGQSAIDLRLTAESARKHLAELSAD